MDLLFSVDAVTSDQNLNSLFHLYDQVESQVRSLNYLGVTSDNYSSLLASVLMNKLSQELKLTITRKWEEDWNLDRILEKLEKKIEARERALPSNINPIKELLTTIPLLQLCYQGQLTDLVVTVFFWCMHFRTNGDMVSIPTLRAFILWPTFFDYVASF